MTWRSEEWGRGTDAFIKSAIDASAPQRPVNGNKEIKENEIKEPFSMFIGTVMVCLREGFHIYPYLVFPTRFVFNVL